MIDLNNIPEQSGVYIFYDKNRIIYIGKAKNLKKRVKSYFQKNYLDLKTKFLIKKINNIEWIITNNEYEALILENNLIKKHKPPFNIKLVDDKTYPYIKIDFKLEFPTLQITRKKDKDKALYFGPFTAVLKLKEVLQFINKNFPLRKCSEKKFKNRIRPCLNYQLHLCPAPCSKEVSKKEYRETLKKVIMFLRGKNDKLIKSLTDDMLEYSDKLEFEKAAKIRDLIENIKIISNQQIIETTSFFDKDIIYFIQKEDNLYFIVIRVKNGKVIDSDFYILKNFKTFSKYILDDFIIEYYNLKPIPDKIVISQKCNIDLIKEYFKKKFSKTIVFNSNDDKFISLAKKNLLEKIAYYEKENNILSIIKNKLKLKNFPLRIDAFDIATFQGKSSVGTRVVFSNNDFNKKLYRKYTIKSVKENIVDDYSMINEVITRSCKEYIETKSLPDLILIDGGKGQLNIGIDVLKKNNLINKIDIIAIAKEKDEKVDKIYLPYRKNPVNLKNHPNILNFFMKIRDEVHRFSVTYHNKKENIKNFSSVLKEINGIGDKRARLLLKHFKSIENIKKSSFEELISLPFINKTIAENIIKFFEKL